MKTIKNRDEGSKKSESHSEMKAIKNRDEGNKKSLKNLSEMKAIKKITAR